LDALEVALQVNWQRIAYRFLDEHGKPCAAKSVASMLRE
jgi:hypothetical protein